MYFYEPMYMVLQRLNSIHVFLTFDTFTRLAFTIVAICNLNYIIKKNNSNNIFQRKRIRSGLIILSPLVIFLMYSFFMVINTQSLYTRSLSYLPVVFINEIVRASYEELLFRGILMTAILIKLQENTGNNNVKVIFISIASGLFFSIIHFPNTWYN